MTDPGPTAILCGECGESVVPGLDEWDLNEQGEDCHASCLACPEDPDGVHFTGCGCDAY